MSNRLKSYDSRAIYAAQSQSQPYQQVPGPMFYNQAYQAQPNIGQLSQEQLEFLQRHEQNRAAAELKSITQAKQTIESLLLSLEIQGRPGEEEVEVPPGKMFDQASLQALYLRFQQEGLPFLTLENRDEIHSFIQVYLEHGVDTAIKCKKEGTLDWDIVLMPGSVKKYFVDMDLMRNKAPSVEGAFPCPKCNSKNTQAIAMQMKSGDEGTDAKATCGDCGMKWIIRG